MRDTHTETQRTRQRKSQENGRATATENCIITFFRLADNYNYYKVSKADKISDGIQTSCIECPFYN